MQIIVTSKNTSEQETLQYYADASDLRLPPGTWPDTLATTLGNGWPFWRAGTPLEDPENIALYIQLGTGAQLTVFND